ncbi:MAG: hypothetical protein ACR2HL_08770, partial [Methylocystis sp.]
DRHSAYVALSRHRDIVDLHYGQDDFDSLDRLTTTLSRDRAKDMVSDYTREQDQALSLALSSSQQDKDQQRAQTSDSPASPTQQNLTSVNLFPESEIKLPEQLVRQQAVFFARQRGIGLETETDAKIDAKPNRDRYRGIFANFAPANASARQKEVPEKQALSPAQERRARVHEAIQKHARSVEDIFEMQEAKLPVLPDQRAALQHSRKILDAFNPHYSKDLEQAYTANHSLAQETANGNPRRAIQVLQIEAEIRANPNLRADRFVQQWQSLTKQRHEHLMSRNYASRDKLTNSMGEMARGLERDPQVESILRNRRQELGLSIHSSSGISMSLLDELGIRRQRSLGLSL